MLYVGRLVDQSSDELVDGIVNKTPADNRVPEQPDGGTCGDGTVLKQPVGHCPAECR